FATGTSLTSDNLPNLRTSLHQFKSKLNYQVSSWVDVSAQYLLENYLSDDFAIDGFDGASADVDNVLLLSGLVPDYNAHVGWLVLSFYPGGRD
ncbi:MAG: MtrB/PioB family outer membrane beta-barrel protein, partial [Nitrospinaceae bacterium]|nr:MtrB/PioB family outer membrane beta-barrel protein [Nitrospinaceae bacterium]NIR54107.1 MtrB/PioB family outer membrane beta-barrel protein [Nitrospinaceae bacterium]NIS84526.1 MtrB/PioB family outer membrane beta-barrel protein [Nitrospinaceae bacterium]NIT81338.1 MtrB/PioB family outer membrane beta-barrel protein [Nitrospinaceae bacterium]NIU43607.1 MtrB/PioB family outer membrane beta-barrel protein [Nitrospinaceae bacterium]